MVTHDLRMCQYVDRVIQMMDGKLARVDRGSRPRSWRWPRVAITSLRA